MDVTEAVGEAETVTDEEAAGEDMAVTDGMTDMARLFVNIGKSQNIRPGDILGAVAGETGISGKLVGSIDMYDNYTFVEVPREYADGVLRAMKDVKIKGKNVHVEKANGKGR